MIFIHIPINTSQLERIFMKHTTIIYPQWQGGGADTSTYYGAKEIEQLYLKNIDYDKVPVNVDNTKIMKSNNIIGYNDILAQMRHATAVINKACPHTLFTIGGGCDADIPAIAYLNKKCAGNLTILWFDAHCDLNTPQESSSKLFYGMPLRTLLGDGDIEMKKLIDHKLTPPQIILLGIRDVDITEENYIVGNNITLLSPKEIERNPNAIFSAINTAGNDNLYLHIDLDVIDPSEFPYIPVPANNGLGVQTFLSVLQLLKEMYSIVGMGLFEYKPAKVKTDLLSSIINIGLHL